MISPEELDLEEVAPPKAKGNKKVKVHSRPHVDKTGHKFVEIGLPPQEEDVNMEDYTVTRVQLRKVTNESAKEDAQVVLDALAGRLDKMEQSQDMYKQKAKHYVVVLRILASSLGNIQPMAIVNLEEPSVQKAEKATQIAKLKS